MIVGDPNPKINMEDYFPFDMPGINLSNIDEALLLKAIEEKEKQKTEYIASANKTISRILKELNRRQRLKSSKNSIL